MQGVPLSNEWLLVAPDSITDLAVSFAIEYQYCRTCGGQRTGRVEYDENDEILEWLRYEMDGLNHLRIDEVYDADSNGELEDPSATGDAWRVQRVYVNGPGQLGQIAKVIVFTYASATTNTVASEDVYYYHYDILGNVSVISDSAGAEADQFEQDAFGNLVSGSWSGRVGGITEQITTKQYDDDLGLYYFNARWYDPSVGAFVSYDTEGDDHSRYQFVHANPAHCFDANGLYAIEAYEYGYKYIWRIDAFRNPARIRVRIKVPLPRAVKNIASVLDALNNADTTPGNGFECCHAVRGWMFWTPVRTIPGSQGEPGSGGRTRVCEEDVHKWMKEWSNNNRFVAKPMHWSIAGHAFTPGTVTLNVAYAMQGEDDSYFGLASTIIHEMLHKYHAWELDAPIESLMHAGEYDGLIACLTAKTMYEFLPEGYSSKDSCCKMAEGVVSY